MIFLYFIQEKRLLDRDPNYLHDHHKQRVDAGENVYEAFFYEPLFFDFLAEKGKKSTEFGALPYLNGGLFSKNLIEKEFEDASPIRLSAPTDYSVTSSTSSRIGTGTWMSGSTLSIRRTSRQPSSVTSSSRRSTKGDGGVLHPEEITGSCLDRRFTPTSLTNSTTRLVLITKR